MRAKEIPQVHQERLALWEHIPLVTPWVIYIEPSGYCNLKCQFCPCGISREKLKKDFMPFKIFKKIIDDLSGFPDKVKLLRICGNGEPLMNKDIIPLLEYAQKKEVAEKIEMLTNGILLTNELIDRLPQNLNRIIVSIEGLGPEDYERICGVRIDFASLLGKLDALYARRGNCKIHIKIHHKAVSSEKEKDIFFNLFSHRCNEIYVEKLVPMWPQLDSVHFTNEFRWLEAGAVHKRRVCVQIFKGMQVQANGEVVPCCVDWDRINVLGDVQSDSIPDIWNGARLRHLQMEHLSGNKPKLKPCKDCTMNDYCEFDNIDLHMQECKQRLREKINIEKI
ncbi:MAG: radical SAM/SPASM domain-containing protein [Candidatus Omnitrophota bacterium]|jgi:radical SAM protein with 4Fe4S-binding SPASM domain